MNVASWNGVSTDSMRNTPSHARRGRPEVCRRLMENGVKMLSITFTLIPQGKSLRQAGPLATKPSPVSVDSSSPSGLLVQSLPTSVCGSRLPPLRTCQWRPASG